MTISAEAFDSKPQPGVVVFVPFDERCPRGIAERIAREVASTCGILLAVLASETSEDWGLLEALVLGRRSADPQPDSTPDNLVITVVPREATIVGRARHTASPVNYRHFAEGLAYLERVVPDLTSRLN